MNAWKPPAPIDWEEIVWSALVEDIGSGDVASGIFDESHIVDWYIEAQADGIICGVGIAEWLFSPGEDDPADNFLEIITTDGMPVQNGTIVCQGKWQASKLLSRERIALNFLMPLSGVATKTHHLVKAIEGTHCKIVDTRKTIPNLRSLQKYAVRCGGGTNHRFGLYDGIMIKDNHIKATGSITKAVEKAKELKSHMMMIEVECESEKMVHEAIQAGADIVMLDNMAPEEMKPIVEKYRGQTIFEASGGITHETIRAVAESGVDAISVGGITHSVPSLSLHLELK